MDVSSVTDTTTNPVVQATENTATNEENSTTEESGNAEASSTFRSLLAKEIGKTSGTQVNEEELFSALIGQRLAKENADAGTYYNSEKAKLSGTMARSDGYIPVEDVANVALRNTVNAGKLDQSLAEKIKGEAFRAAQLDDNLGALYDSRGSATDLTIAQADFDTAMAAAEDIMTKIESGEMTADSRALDLGATGTAGSSSASGVSSGSGADLSGALNAADGAEGFLWKPKSDSDGKLVVLLPTELRGLIGKVEIHSSLPPEEATKLADGRFSGDDDNGARPHYRFDKAGGDYGDNIYVVAYKTDGSTVSWKIDDGSQRVD